MGSRGVGKDLLKVLGVPFLKRLKGFAPRFLVLILGEKDQDFDLLIQRDRQVALRAFTPDDCGSRSLAKSINKSFRNGLSLREQDFLGRRASNELT